MTSTNLAYDVDTTIMVYMYFQNMPADSMEMDFQFSVPPSTATVPYKMVGSDSIYMSSGSIMMSGTTGQTEPGGMKVKIEGNRLYLISNDDKVTTENQQGMTIKTVRKARATATYEKL